MSQDNGLGPMFWNYINTYSFYGSRNRMFSLQKLTVAVLVLPFTLYLKLSSPFHSSPSSTCYCPGRNLSVPMYSKTWLCLLLVSLYFLLSTPFLKLPHYLKGIKQLISSPVFTGHFSPPFMERYLPSGLIITIKKSLYC